MLSCMPPTTYGQSHTFIGKPKISKQLNMKPVFISLILMCLSLAATAQNKSSDIVILNNGDRMVGEIIKYEQDHKLILRQADGNEIEILAEDIKRITQEVYGEIITESSGPYPPKEKTNVKPRTKGRYVISQLAFAMGRNPEDGVSLGAGLSVIYGYQFKPALGMGIGLGLDNYARRGETIYPIFVDIRSYLPIKKKPGAYYVVLNGGYGFAFKRESIGIKGAEGGYMLYPAIGYRTTTREGVDVNIDAGIKWQKASFTRDLFTGDIEVRDLTFQRFTVRVGITLWGKR